jgi:hypothetical protein
MTANLPLFYKKIVPLSRERHGDLYVKPVEGYGFARETNSLFIAAIEFPRVMREYPIVFGQTGEQSVFPVVLLGLKSNQNLFVDGAGAWTGDYIPAYVRRYPFILAAGGNGGSFTVCVDESYPGFNRNKEGQRLFDEGGGESELLKRSVEFLKEYQTHIQLTNRFCEKLKELDLLEPMQANIELKSGEKVSMRGFSCVTRDRLKKLDAGVLAELVKSDHMELICAHLLSLNNLDALLKRYGNAVPKKKTSAGKKVQ